MNATISVLAVVGLAAGVWLAAFTPKSRAADSPSTRPDTQDAPAAGASNAFGFDLYGQLARRGAAGKNLFFSPYSITNALAMTAEGARGQTAEQMDAVMRFPSSLKTGDSWRPYDLSPIHAGLADINEHLTPKPALPELRDKIASLRQQLDATNKDLESNHNYDQARMEKQRSAQKLADELNKLLPQVDQYELRVANALWGEKSFNFEQPYLDTIARFYKTGGFFPMDFGHDPEGCRQQINDWVAKQTNDRIKDLIARGLIKEATRLVLTNAVYFKGDWAEPFDASETNPGDFTTADGSKASVPLMHQSRMKGASYAAFNADGSYFGTPKMVRLDQLNDTASLYPTAGGFLVAELPYKGGDLSMVLIAPQSTDGLAKVEGMLTEQNISTWLGKLEQRELNVVMPKFKLDTSYQLAESLNALGMTRAFVDPGMPDGAQFDGISASKDPAKRLYISAVVHKAYVDVNEKGTEAAAATAVIMMAGSAAPVNVPFVPTFTADRPFVFLIRDRASGAILFLGRITNPAATS
jgi:serine protease inhibitor